MWGIYITNGKETKYLKYCVSEEMAMDECRETNYIHIDENGQSWEMRIKKAQLLY